MCGECQCSSKAHLYLNKNLRKVREACGKWIVLTFEYGTCSVLWNFRGSIFFTVRYKGHILNKMIGPNITEYAISGAVG
jgi:hypothetical protein